MNQNNLIPASQQFMRQNNSQRSNRSNEEYIQQQQQQYIQQYNIEQQHMQQQQQQFQQQQQQPQQSFSNSQSQSMLQSSPQGPAQLLDMTIDLGQNQIKQIKVFENQDPYDIAEQFCKDNDLTEDAIGILAQNIENNLREVLEERQQKRQEEEQQIDQEQQEQYELEQQQQQLQQQQQQLEDYSSQIQKQQQYQQEQQQSSTNQKSNLQQSKSSQKFNNTNNNLSESQQQYGYQNINMFHVSPYKSQDFQSFQPNYNNTFTEGQLGNQQKNKINQRGNIYDRLYNDAQSKKIRQEQRHQNVLQNHEQKHKNIHSNKKVGKRQFGNYELNVGEYLYYQAQQKKEQTMEYEQRQRFEQLQKDEENLTFHPQISEKSAKLAEMKKQHQNLPEERFELDSRIRQEKQERLKNQMRNEQLSDCSFHPKINKISAKIIEEKQKSQLVPNNAKFEQLYNDAKNRTLRQFNEKQKVDELNNQKPSFMNRPPVNDDGTPFLERMERNIKLKQEKDQQNELQSQQSQQIESSKFQFKPQTGRAPQFDRNSQGLPIGEYLYKQQELNEQKQLFKYQQQLEFEQSLMFKKSGSSNQIVEEKKRNILRNIFEEMDSDGDGIISKQSINLANIDGETLQTLAEFLHLMEKQDIQYDFDNFYSDVTAFLSNLPFAERDKIFFNFKKKWENKKESQQERLSYKPDINYKSSKISEKIRGKNPDLYAQGQEKLSIKKDKILIEKQNQLNKEMMECSFKPKLYKPIGIYSFSHVSPKSHQKMKQLFDNQENESFENNSNNINNQYIQNMQNEQQQLQQFANDELYIREQQQQQQHQEIDDQQ